METFCLADLPEADHGSSVSSIHSTEVNSPESEQSSSSLSPKRHGNPTNPNVSGIEARVVDVNTVCLICGDKAIRHVHYGGRCCFSCKAFFRRAVNWHNSKVKLFQCRNLQSCRIDIKSRKCCQYCRFQVRKLNNIETVKPKLAPRFAESSKGTALLLLSTSCFCNVRWIARG